MQDATWFSDFIYQYVTRNERWLSPKFLIGESYGTTRSAQLSNVLQHRHEMYLNGVALLSSVGFGNWGADDRTKFWLPDDYLFGLVPQPARSRFAEADH